jgi:FkbM family methyltransferase
MLRTFFALLCTIVYSDITFVARADVCSSAPLGEHGSSGQSMLQTKYERASRSTISRPTADLSLLRPTGGTSYKGRRSKENFGNCKLPVGAVWCEVRLQFLPAFWMAVYDEDLKPDWVSMNICAHGHWEDSNFHQFGPPGHMLDIGGQLGYYGIAFAKAGWNVTLFEPMKPNLELLDATLCRNLDTKHRIKVNEFGLGTESQECKMVRPSNNAGDGFVTCPGKKGSPADHIVNNSFVEVGSFHIRRLDEVLNEQDIDSVKVVKIDVEGYEAQVFAGAPHFLKQYRPKVIKSEVWWQLVGSDGPVKGIDYLDMFTNQGYTFFSDSSCETPMDPKAALNLGSVDVVMCLV